MGDAVPARDLDALPQELPGLTEPAGTVLALARLSKEGQ